MRAVIEAPCGNCNDCMHVRAAINMQDGGELGSVIFPPVSKQAGIIAKPAGTLDRFRPIPSACILRHSTSITYLKYHSINALKPDSFDSFDNFDILDKFNKLN